MAVCRPHSLELGSKSFLEKSPGQRTPMLATLPQAHPAETRSSGPAGDEKPAVHSSLCGHYVAHVLESEPSHLIRLGPQNRASRSAIWKTDEPFQLIPW